MATEVGVEGHGGATPAEGTSLSTPRSAPPCPLPSVSAVWEISTGQGSAGNGRWGVGQHGAGGWEGARSVRTGRPDGNSMSPGVPSTQQRCLSHPGCGSRAHPAALQVHSLQELRRSASLATKVFVQRDYSDGTTCQFQTKFPPELESRIERQLFEETVKTLNGFYAEAEKIGSSSYLEGCLACATAYFIFLCMETHYEKVLKKISKYIQEQNEKVYAPRGLLLTDPLERGMRVIEISIYEDRCSSGSSSSGSSSSSSGGGGGRAGGR
ncbi:golgin subfamily A member 7B [Phaethornis superciliosus]